MYNKETTGSWPKIDIGQPRIYDTTTTGVTQPTGSGLLPYLDASNLGTGTQAYMSLVHNNTFNIAAGSATAFGVCLAPLNTITSSLEDYQIELAIQANTYYSGNHNWSPFIGLIDTAAIAIGVGWNANNNVTNYGLIPNTSNFAVCNVNNTVLLQSFLSGDKHEDKFLCVGAALMNLGTAAITVTQAHVCISARYALGRHKTIDQDFPS